MRAILTRSMWIFLLLRSMRDGIKSDRVIILDRARWERDGMEAFHKHELNPLWWAVVIFLPLLTTAAMHWVAWK